MEKTDQKALFGACGDLATNLVIGNAVVAQNGDISHKLPDNISVSIARRPQQGAEDRISLRLEEHPNLQDMGGFVQLDMDVPDGETPTPSRRYVAVRGECSGRFLWLARKFDANALGVFYRSTEVGADEALRTIREIAEFALLAPREP